MNIRQNALSLREPGLSPVSSLPTLNELRTQFALTRESSQSVDRSRRSIWDSISGQDPRFLVIVGPCSLHDPVAALDYGRRLQKLSSELGDRLLIVMRAYVEKPRTRLGWKGLILEPDPAGPPDPLTGLRVTRQCLLQLIEAGLPLAVEALNPHLFRYIEDLAAWVAIGARTCESPLHRELSSDLAAPVGFKNSTDGSLAGAINSIHAARASHTLISASESDGTLGVRMSPGNDRGHLILRGGVTGPNYETDHIRNALSQLRVNGLPERLIVDCSHANSQRDPARQAEVLRCLLAQRRAGQRGIAGIMLESFIHEGRQEPGAALRYGQSITDACLSWEATESLLRELYSELSARVQATVP